MKRRMSPRTAVLPFRLSIERALIVLYKRRAQIEDLIACLDLPGNWTGKNAKLTDMSSQLRKIRKEASTHFSGGFWQRRVISRQNTATGMKHVRPLSERM